jgi:hypothetical protein
MFFSRFRCHSCEGDIRACFFFKYHIYLKDETDYLVCSCDFPIIGRGYSYFDRTHNNFTQRFLGKICPLIPCYDRWRARRQSIKDLRRNNDDLQEEHFRMRAMEEKYRLPKYQSIFEGSTQDAIQIQSSSKNIEAHEHQVSKNVMS